MRHPELAAPLVAPVEQDRVRIFVRLRNEAAIPGLRPFIRIYTISILVHLFVLHLINLYNIDLRRQPLRAARAAIFLALYLDFTAAVLASELQILITTIIIHFL